MNGVVVLDQDAARMTKQTGELMQSMTSWMANLSIAVILNYRHLKWMKRTVLHTMARSFQYLDVTWLWCKATQARRGLHGGVLSLQKTFVEWNRTQHLPAVVEAAGAFFKNQVFCHSAECLLYSAKVHRFQLLPCVGHAIDF